MEPTENRKTPLSRDHAIILLDLMERFADPYKELALTVENWDAEFGLSGILSTPIGNVKMGENQYLKLARKGREGKLSMIRPTLTNPDIIIKDSSQAKEGQETQRNFSYIFVKTFIGNDHCRHYHFTSVTVQQGSQEVVVSNEEKSLQRMLNLLQSGIIIWSNEEKFSQGRRNYRLVSETQVGNPVSLGDSRMDIKAGKVATPLGINSPDNFLKSKDTYQKASKQFSNKKNRGFRI